MGFDMLDLSLQVIVFFIYGSIFIISLIFTFSLETYRKIDEKINLEIFSTPSPLQININWLDLWLMERHKTVGFILTLLSLLDLKLSLDVIKDLSILFPAQ